MKRGELYRLRPALPPEAGALFRRSKPAAADRPDLMDRNLCTRIHALCLKSEKLRKLDNALMTAIDISTNVEFSA
jgi:hypothetical protein